MSCAPATRAVCGEAANTDLHGFVSAILSLQDVG